MSELRGRELALKTLEFIKENPEKWDQKNWRKEYECGTVMCFAGWCVVLGGDYEDYDDDLSIPLQADRLLGLVGDDFARHHTLFSAFNSYEDLVDLVDKYLPEEKS